MSSKQISDNGYEHEVSFRPNFDPVILREIVYADIKDFEKLGTVDSVGNVFIDNNSDVLFVAHRDYVPTEVFCAIDGKYIVFSPQLDDRLGIYVALHLLPQYGIHPDILLTDDEEIGRTTAQNFYPQKEYNWMFQFDRRGNDAVTYEYTDKAWLTALLSSGFKIGQGSFSDICSLDHLGVCGVNVGTAYYNEHGITCHAILPTLFDQVDTFATFWKKNFGKRFPHTVQPKEVKSVAWPNWNRDRTYRHYDYTYYDELDCEYCKKSFKDDFNVESIMNYGACEECYDSLSSDSKSYRYEDDDRPYCEVCGNFMPDGDFKDGICFSCYEQMLK